MKTSFDPAKRLDLYFRTNRNGSKKFIFFDVNGLPYDITALTFEFNIKFQANSTAVKLQLPVVKNGNELLVTISNTQSNIGIQTYYYELYVSSSGKTWLTGQANFHNGIFDGVEDTSNIIIGDSTVSITISDGNPTILDGTFFIINEAYTALVLPSNGGTGVAGIINRGNAVIVSGIRNITDGAAVTYEIGDGTILLAKTKNPANLWSNWRII